MIEEILKVIGTITLVILVSILLSGVLSGLEININGFHWEFAGIIELLNRGGK